MPVLLISYLLLKRHCSASNAFLVFRLYISQVHLYVMHWRGMLWKLKNMLPEVPNLRQWPTILQVFQMGFRRFRCLRGQFVPLLYVGMALIVLWILILISNSFSRARLEHRYDNRAQQIVLDRRELHMRALYAEIKALIRRPATNWTAFLHGPLADNFRRAPCSCGNCPNDSIRPNCPAATSGLRGDLTRDIELAQSLKPARPHRLAAPATVRAGGAWSPPECRPGHRVVIVVPFRDRWPQLKILLAVLHPMLQRQQLCYRIFVVEQYGCQAFNKGRLNNAGFLEASKRFHFDCVIFQDADIVPLNDRNPYSCPAARPRHMAVAVDVHKFRLPYSALVGGVIAFRTEHYVRVNGYSNFYWGWGLEDDDMEIRMKTATKLRYARPSRFVARYKALSHRPQRIYSLQGARRKPLLSTILRRYAKDGLNSVDYEVMAVREQPAYTHLLLDIGQQPAEFNDD